MKALISWALALLSATSVSAADGDGEDGYIGYRLDQRGDPESTTYETANTSPGVVLSEDPDVYLNASVSVGLIDIEVENITAKVNLDAQVLNLLRINAGVDASIDRVKLTIEDVSAKVLLEARLGNVVAMIDDVLNSIDLNPIIATLGQTVTDVVDGVGDIIDSPGDGNTDPDLNTTTTKRSTMDYNYNLDHNILYSVNDYTGQTHTNRILGQNGDIYDEHLDSDGEETRGRTVVGYYARDMTFNGHNRTVEEEDGAPKVFELQYVYEPFPGLEVTSWVYVDLGGEVVRTQVIAEASGGGGSTISNDSDL